MLPDGWKHGRVKDVVDSLDSGVSVNGEDRLKNSDEIGVLKISAVTYGTFNPEEYKTVIPEDVSRAKLNPKKGQILISRSNTEALVGASCYIDKDYLDLYLPDKLWQTVPNTASRVDTLWLSYLLASKHVRYRLSKLATGTSGSMKNITKGELLTLPVDIPPPIEQTKIAQILSTWDKAIETVEKLIENSKQQKKALMQQLLTGKKRFKEFVEPAKYGELPEGWVNSNVGENIDLLSGFAFPSSKYQTKGLKLLRGINITRGSLRWKESDTKYWPDSDDFEKYLLEINDVVISMDGSLVGRNFSLITEENYEPMLLLQRVARLRCKEYLHHNYLYLHIASPRFENYVDAVKTITAIPHISAKDIRSYSLPLPPLEEQLRIESVLMSAQAEIDVQENKLKKLELEKKALMQQLLTGKRCVKVDANEPAAATA